MKKLCESFRECTMNIINFKKKKRSYQQKSRMIYMKMHKSVNFEQTNLKINILKIKNIANVEIIVIIQEDIEVRPISYVI